METTYPVVSTEQMVAPTVSALQKIGPRCIIAGQLVHWTMNRQIANALPEASIANSVGTEFILYANH